MAPPRMSPWLTFLMALLILGGAGMVRGWYLTAWTDAGAGGPSWQVQANLRTLNAEGKSDLDALAENLKSRGFVHGFRSHAPLATAEEETAHLAPGYPALRALAEGQLASYAGFSEQPAQFLRWVQVGLGSFTALFVFLTATRAFHSRFVGLLAGLAAVGHPYWVLNTAEIQDGVLATFFVSFALYLAVRAGQQGGALTALLLGIVLAAAAMTRAALLPFAVVILIWYLWRTRIQNGGWLFALVCFFGFACGMASWAVRCQQQLGEPVPVTSAAWWHLWVGNNPLATGGPYGVEMEKALSPERRAELAKLPQASRYAELSKEVLKEVQENPHSTLARRAKALLYFFFGMTEPKRANLMAYGETGKPEAWLINLLGGMLLAMFLLAALGWRWSYGWKNATAPLAIAVVWIPLPYLLSHAEPLHGPRMPLDAALLILASMALACFMPVVGGRLLRGEAALAAQ